MSNYRERALKLFQGATEDYQTYNESLHESLP